MTDRQFPLTAAKHAAIYRKIEDHHFSGTTPQDKPRAIILGGQPDAGKSGLLEASKQDFPGGNVVAINGDELRYYHPQYREIQKADERHFAELTDPHARKWRKALASISKRPKAWPRHFASTAPAPFHWRARQLHLMPLSNSYLNSRRNPTLDMLARGVSHEVSRSQAPPSFRDPATAQA